MKETKFIELLNLYVDQEISAQDARQLELEIAHNPERRKVYLQYCRMHRASAVLFESFKAGAKPVGDNLAEAAKRVDDKILLFPAKSSSRSRRWAYASGLVAAAACLAFVLVKNDSLRPGTVQPPSGDMLVLRNPHFNKPPVPKDSEQQLAVSTRPSAREVDPAQNYLPVFVSDPLESNPFDLDAPRALMADKVGTLEWVNQVRLQPLISKPIDTMRFQRSQPLLNPESRTLRLQTQDDAQVEMTAFQFER